MGIVKYISLIWHFLVYCTSERERPYTIALLFSSQSCLLLNKSVFTGKFMWTMNCVSTKFMLFDQLCRMNIFAKLPLNKSLSLSLAQLLCQMNGSKRIQAFSCIPSQKYASIQYTWASRMSSHLKPLLRIEQRNSKIDQQNLFYLSSFFLKPVLVRTL